MQNLTPLRTKVLTLLLHADRPAKAYDLLRHLSDDGNAKPTTVYRALDFLVDSGLAHGIASMDAFAACGRWAHEHTAIFLICDLCGSVGEAVSRDGMEVLDREIREVQFQPRQATIELRGTCAACS
jgi:Fur family zinc uptake transcriptional regulator